MINLKNNYIQDKYLKYAQDVVSGKQVAGKLIKLSCQRYLDFMNDTRYEFRPDKCERVLSFVSKLKHYQGKCAGKPFVLEEWQKWIIYSIFGFYYRDSNERLVKKALLTVGRKNGKSFLIAAIALYMLIADGEPAAQVLNIANNTKQAHLLFEMQQKLVKCLDPKHKYTKTLRDSIQVPKTSSYSQVLSSDSSGHDGSSPSTYILDEVHEMKDSKLWDVMVSGTGFRVSPLGICISTSGFLLNGFLHNYRDVCIDILEHRKEDDEQFAAIYELDDEDDWKDEKNWVKANPNLDVTVTRKYLEGQIRSAINDSALEVSVKTKNFNMWVSSKEIWISDDKIRKVMSPVNLDDYKDEDCFMGVDLSAVSDLTSTTIMFPPNPDREINPDKFVFKTIIYLPESELTENVNSYLYMIWKRENYLKVTSGNVVDYDYILKDQININDKNYVVNVAYDKWNATQWAINATEEGLPLTPYSQALGNFNGPTKTLERLIRTGMVVIDNNPIVRWAFSNVTLKLDQHENAKPTKANNDKSKKIDPVISMIQSLGGYLENPRYSDGQVLAVK